MESANWMKKTNLIFTGRRLNFGFQIDIENEKKNWMFSVAKDGVVRKIKYIPMPSQNVIQKV